MRISSSLATLFLESNGTSHTHGRIVIDTDSNSRGGGVYWRDTTNHRQFFNGVAYAGAGVKWQVGYHSGSEGSLPEDAANQASSILTVHADTSQTGVGKVGIGTTSPDTLLHIEAADSPTFKIEDTTNNATLQAAAIDSSVYIGATSNHAFNLRTNNTGS